MRAALLLVVAAATAAVAAIEHSCQHAEMQQKTERVAVPQRRRAVGPPRRAGDKRRGVLTPDETEPIRVTVVDDLLSSGDDAGTCLSLSDTYFDPVDGSVRACTEEQLVTAERRSTIIEVMDETVSWMQSTFRVQPLDPGVTTTDERLCGGIATIPSDTEYDADLVLFLSARPTQNRTLAYALSCIVDGATRRPVIGLINFGPASLDSATFDFETTLKTAMHETVHVLGVSFATSAPGGVLQPINPTFYDPDTDSTYEYDFLEEVVTNVPSPYTIYKVDTPNVVQRARAHFGCNTIDGVALEDVNIAGTGIVHWEKRLFLNEFMTGTLDSVNVPVVSPITLAFLEDTGWYNVDYSGAETLVWGRNQGCSWFDARCNEWEEETYFCSSPSEPVCSFDHHHRAFCSLLQYTSLDDNFEYFSDPDVGGSQALADFCPIPTGFSNGDCRETANEDPVAVDAFGELYCSNCKCAKTTANFAGDADLLSTTTVEATEVRSGCYEMRCVSPSRLKIRPGLGQEIWYDCPTGSNIAMVGYVGLVECPNNENVCYGAAVEDGWPIVTGISPTKFEDAGGQTITVTGLEFGTDSVLTIGGNRAEILSIEASGEQIIALTPEIASNSNSNFLAPLVVTRESTGKTGQAFNLYQVEVSRLGLALATDAVSDFSSFLSKFWLPVSLGAVIGTAAVVAIIRFTKTRSSSKSNVVVVKRRPAGSFPSIRENPKW